MNDIKIRFFQPSWFLLQVKIKDQLQTIYIDPAYLKKYYSSLPSNILFSSWPNQIDGLPEKSLPKADIILITHHHKDHCKAVTVKRLLKKDGIIFAPKSCKKELGEKIRIVQPNETLTIKNIVVHTLNAYNTPEGSSTTKQHKLGEGIGYILDICGKRIYHAGDTDVIPDMSKLGKIDIAMLPIGGRFTMNSKEAIEAVKIIKPSMVIPMHNLDRSMLDFVEEVEKQTESTAISMEIGGIFHLKI